MFETLALSRPYFTLIDHIPPQARHTNVVSVKLCDVLYDTCVPQPLAELPDHAFRSFPIALHSKARSPNHTRQKRHNQLESVMLAVAPPVEALPWQC